MSFVYACDFSETSIGTAPGAAAVASRLGKPLLLVHIADPRVRTLSAELENRVEAEALQRLEALAGELRSTYPRLEVRALQLHGDPVEALQALVTRAQAELLMVASGGHPEARGRIGSVSERLAHRASIPVLVMREPKPWLEWAAGRRPLQVVLGVSRDASSRAALEMTTRLRNAAPCDVVATEVYFVPELAAHYGLVPPPYWLTVDPGLEELVARDLRTRTAGLGGSGELRFRPHLAVGGIADHLLDAAEREQADLVIVGRHSPAGPFRLGSVSEAVLHRGRMSVLIVPALSREIGPRPPPQLRRVLAATDLSSFGNQAVRYAVALAQATSGELHLFHLAESKGQGWEDETGLAAKLRGLLPERWPYPVSTEVVFGGEPSSAIASAAERFAADAICVASHSRQGLARLGLGSVTEGLLRKTHRPVLVVRPSEE